jgi:hypothetical protein
MRQYVLHSYASSTSGPRLLQEIEHGPLVSISVTWGPRDLGLGTGTRQGRNRTQTRSTPSSDACCRSIGPCCMAQLFLAATACHCLPLLATAVLSRTPSCMSLPLGELPTEVGNQVQRAFRDMVDRVAVAVAGENQKREPAIRSRVGGRRCRLMGFPRFLCTYVPTAHASTHNIATA